MRFEPFLVKVNFKDKTFSEYGRNRENPQNCAKRIFYENTGIEKEHVIGIDGSQFLSVDKVPQDVRKEWPNGMKSIPVYIFKVE